MKGLFFNSVNGDRRYKAEDFASYFNQILTTGVFTNPSTSLQVISNNTMKVTVKAGACNINGFFGIQETDEVLNIEVATPAKNRIDLVVARWNWNTRDITLAVKKDTTTLTRTADIFELCLAEITVNRGASEITQANIKDTRQLADKCGVVNSLIKVDPTTLFLQFQNSFDNWFNDIKGKLNADVAGSLQMQIDKKFEIYLGETLPSISQRKQNTIYCKITDKVNSGTGGNVTIRVSPNLGIKV